jgi:hypothetical protein
VSFAISRGVTPQALMDEGFAHKGRDSVGV